MLTSLALIFLAGLAMAALCSLLRLPRIIGMLFTGILLGPYVLGLLDPSILAISADLRQMALIIILIKEGLSLDLGDLRRVGRPAVLMSFLPASFEILAYILFAPMLLWPAPVWTGRSGSSASLPICPRPRYRPPSVRCRWQWVCPAELWCSRWQCWRSLSQRRWEPSASTVPAAVCCVPQTDLPIFPQNKKPELSAQESSGFCFISQCYRISTCSAFMALRAFSWASGVTPAQQLARTVIGTSGQ